MKNLLFASLLAFVSFLCSTANATIDVDVLNVTGNLSNNSGGINLHGRPSNQSIFLDEIGADIYRLKIRLYRVLNDGGVYSNFPWEGDDWTMDDMMNYAETINEAKTKGGKLLIQIYGMPLWLSMSQDEEVVTNGIPNYAKYPPTDYLEWAKLVRGTIDKLINEFNLEIDYYQIFGEVNAGSTWYVEMMPCKVGDEIIFGCVPNDLGHKTREIMDNFFKIYTFSYLGIQSIDPDAGNKITGIAIIPDHSGMWWTRFFCQYLNVMSHSLALYSWQLYDDDLIPKFYNLISPYYPLDKTDVRNIFEQGYAASGFTPDQIDIMIDDIYYFLKAIEENYEDALRHPYSFISSHLKRILSEENFNNIDLILTEWHAAIDFLEKNDSHYASSFITRGLIDLSESYTTKQTIFTLGPVVNRIYDIDRGYLGHHAIFTLATDSVPKASYNAIKLFSMLGDNVNRLSTVSSDNDIYSIATMNGSTINLLTTYYERADDPVYSITKDVNINITNIPFVEYTYTTYLIDSTHSNSYLYSGPDLEIGEQGSHYGDYQKNIVLDIYGTTLIQIEAVEPPTPPTVPIVIDDGDYTSDPTTFHASWSSDDPESGIKEYLYAIGTAPRKFDILWGNAGQNNEITIEDLNLQDGITYYFTVRAINNVDLYSHGWSDGITVDSIEPEVTNLTLPSQSREQVTFVVEALDAISKIDMVKLTINGVISFDMFDAGDNQYGKIFYNTPTGTFQYDVIAYDNAGNETSIGPFSLEIH